MYRLSTLLRASYISQRALIISDHSVVISQAWRSHNQGKNNVANRLNRQGIHVSHASRTFRDEEGKNFWVDIEITDNYRVPSGSQAPYNVTVRYD